ncbi:MAG TPA: hypothetical protein VF784_12705 [Anaerolineales bacterium]
MLNKSHTNTVATGPTARTLVSKSRARTDVQWIISSVSIAITLGLWGLFASDAKKVAGVAAQVTIAPPPDQVVATQPRVQTLLPGQVLLFEGTAPKPQVQPVQPQTIVTAKPRHKSGGGSSGPAASTGSSHP